MLGIIGAMDVEVDALKALITAEKITHAAGLDFVCGRLEGTEVCLVRCNPGKVNAALCTQQLIDRFAPDAIINIGVGCSLHRDVVIKNIVVADAVCQYDFDTSAIDGVKGLVIDNRTSLPTDARLSDGLYRAALATGCTVHRGTVATGDTFIASDTLKQEIAGTFGAICGEMEGGAIGHVCYVNQVPFAVLRTVSDGGDAAAAMDYPTFKEAAAAISTATVKRFLQES